MLTGYNGFNHFFERSSHFIEGRTSTGTETFCPLICLDASQFVLLIGAENQLNYRIQGQFSRYIFVEVAR